MANPKTPGDLFFENYCALNGYDPEYGVRWHERFGVNTDKDPDYLIERVGDRAIVEVKHFETRRMKDQLLATPGRAMYFGGPELYAKLQASVRAAAQEQLAPFASVGLPLVVVVTNPMQSDVSFDPDDVVSALFGQVELAVDPEPGGRIQAVFSEDGAVLTHGADGILINRLPHLSAVAALYGLEDFARVDVYDLSGVPGFTGTPVPNTMFDGDATRWFGFTDDRHAAARRVVALGPSGRELYPEVVDAGEEEGGVPSRLIKTDRREAERKARQWRMFAGSPSGRTTRAGSRWMISRGRVLAG